MIDEELDAGTGAEESPNGEATGSSKRAGRRRDGRPFADGNVREDGDYSVGKGRTPEHTRFAANDGRRRGRRPKGSRNFDKDWEEELSRKVTLTRDGRELTVSAHHAQVMTTMALAAKGRERSQELVFRKAGEVAERRRAVQSHSDDALIAEWMAQQQTESAETEIVGDDDPKLESEIRSDSDDPE